MKAVRLAALALITVTLGGCFIGWAAPTVDHRAEVTAKELVGAWQNNVGDTLTFERGAEFSATNLPYEEFEGFPISLPQGFDPVRDELPGSGTWDVAASREDPDGPTSRVRLHVKELAGQPVSVGAELFAEKQGDSVILAFYIGDPDLQDKTIFRK